MSEWNSTIVTMMKEEPDKKEEIKLESELVLEDDIQPCTGLNQELSCEVENVSTSKQKPDVRGNTDVKAPNDFSSGTKFKREDGFVLNLVPRIKVEEIENGVSSTDPFPGSGYQSSLLAVSTESLQTNSSFSVEAIRIKAENGLAEDFLMDCTKQISSKIVSHAPYAETASFPLEKNVVKTEKSAPEVKNQPINLHMLDVTKTEEDPRIETNSGERYSAAPPDTMSSLPAGSSASIASEPQVDSSDGAYHDDSSLQCFGSTLLSETEPRIQAEFGAVVDPRKFVCIKCAAKFKRKEYLNQHLLTHSNERPFACKQCPARFKTKKLLTGHLVTHSNEKPFPCKMCPARFKVKRYLDGHIISLHSDARPFSCEQCSASFKFKKNLQQHLRMTHSDDRPFSCNQCLARFKSKSNLNKHLWVHSDKRPFSCEHCSASFKLKGNLKKHLLSVHSDNRPFSCEHCPARFKLKNELLKHLRVHSY